MRFRRSLPALAAALVLAGCGDPKIEWRGLKLVRPPEPKVTQTEIAKFFDQLREQRATRTPLPAGTALRKGDVAVIDFVGTVGGVPFDGGTASGYSLTLGSGQMIPGFEDGLVGLKPGQTKDVKVRFPKNYQEASLAGKDAVFKVTVRAGQALHRPELDDEFARAITGGRFPTVAALRKIAPQVVAQNLQQQAEASLRQQAVEQLLARWPKEPSAREVDAELERVVQDQLQRNAAAGGGPAQGGPDADALRTSLKPAVTKQVKISRMLAAIGRREGVSVSDAEVEQAVGQMAAQQGKDPKAVMAELKERKLLDLVRRQLLEQRVVSLILQNAAIEGATPAVPRFAPPPGAPGR